jgi:hypothetical protein
MHRVQIKLLHSSFWVREHQVYNHKLQLITMALARYQKLSLGLTKWLAMSVLCFKMTVKKQHLKKLLHPNNLLDSKSVHPTLTTTYLKLRCYQRKSKWSATLLILLCQLTLTALIALLKYPWCLMMTSLCNRQRVPQTARLNIAVA